MFLMGISQSEATTDIQLEFQKAANLALNDKGVWEQIKDFSLATPMVGPKEVNIPNPIKSGGDLQKAYETQIKPGSKIENTGKIMEGIPSSELNKPIIKG